MAFTPRLLLSAARNWRRVLPLMRDDRVPTALKIGAAIAGVLIISPMDILGDIPVIGVFDDAVLLTAVCSAFVWLATRAMAVPARQTIGGLPARII